MKPQNLSLYIDWGSQPCRAIAALCLYGKVPHNLIETRIFKGENRSEEYTKINPDRKVPAMQETQENGDKFNLFESHAIMRYICDSRQLDEHLYPKNLQKRAKLDAYLDWHHQNTRKGGWLVFNTMFAPKIGIKPFMDLKKLRSVVDVALQLIDTEFLKEGKYLMGMDQFTIADISCYCEIIQLKFLSWDLNQYPNIASWIKKMEQLECIQNSHIQFNQFIKRVEQNNKKEKQSPKL